MEPTITGRDENYMQNVMFRGRSLNPRTPELSVVISAIVESRIPGGTKYRPVTFGLCFLPSSGTDKYYCIYTVYIQIHCI